MEAHVIEQFNANIDSYIDEYFKNYDMTIDENTKSFAKFFYVQGLRYGFDIWKSTLDEYYNEDLWNTLYND